MPEPHDELCLRWTACDAGNSRVCHCALIRKVRAEFAVLREALEFYADPATYHALMIWSDPPCGEFMEDFSEDHGDDFYGRPMPGKRARAALAALDGGGDE